MTTRIQDEILGTLTYEWFWKGRVRLPRTGMVDLQIEGEIAPGILHHRLYLVFAASWESELQAAEAMLFEYYNRVANIYRAPHLRSVEDTELEVPVLKHSRDIWQLLSKPTLFFPDQMEFPSMLQLTWNCTWDIERGVSIVYRNCEAVKIGIDSSDIFDEFL